MQTVKKSLVKHRFLCVCIIAVCICWYVSACWYQLMLIHGSSMEPAYHDGQIVILNKHDRTYAVGDVIAIDCEGLNAVIVKRIARIQDGRYYVLGDNLKESVDSRDERVGLVDPEDVVGRVVK